MHLTKTIAATLALATTAVSTPMEKGANDTVIAPAPTKDDMVPRWGWTGCPFSRTKCQWKCMEHGFQSGVCGGYFHVECDCTHFLEPIEVIPS
ncbi:hypothetical protein E8E13_008931 [Curvularia kusanoi]|uniref:Invertebrate defensins family profile domain-containing protein n=1 Tax=Curvularia kusanoi TaxID=90978 RepID=A0A9P4TK17_CURKU|nr:hypothetical protein E8E13_008931 [Curvularia kusanoi]